MLEKEYTIGVRDIWWRVVLTEIIHKRHSSSSNDHRDTLFKLRKTFINPMKA